jgi:hypothetical protein
MEFIHHLQPGDVIIYPDDLTIAPQWSKRWTVDWVGPESLYPEIDRYNVLLSADHSTGKIGMSAPHRSILRQIQAGMITLLRNESLSSHKQ